MRGFLLNSNLINGAKKVDIRTVTNGTIVNCGFRPDALMLIRTDKVNGVVVYNSIDNAYFACKDSWNTEYSSSNLVYIDYAIQLSDTGYRAMIPNGGDGQVQGTFSLYCIAVKH